MLAETIWEKLEIAWEKWVTIANVSEVKWSRACGVVEPTVAIELFLFSSFEHFRRCSNVVYRFSELFIGLQLIKLYRGIRSDLIDAKSLNFNYSVSICFPHRSITYALYYLLFSVTIILCEKWRIKTSELHCGLLKRGRNLFRRVYIRWFIPGIIKIVLLYMLNLSLLADTSPSRRRRGK